MRMAFQRWDYESPSSSIGADWSTQELYEPLWDELYECLKAKNIRIRNIFIADVAHQGVSGVLNEQKLGNDRKWRSCPLLNVR